MHDAEQQLFTPPMGNRFSGRMVNRLGNFGIVLWRVKFQHKGHPKPAARHRTIEIIRQKFAPCSYSSLLFIILHQWPNQAIPLSSVNCRYLSVQTHTIFPINIFDWLGSTVFL
jgi:hypothetical protein